ncbi:MAG: GMC family oxidoreductase [Proteobacteria bacterium]|nr:GMC family oxidoreductase [Pseudomonadota bacterium]
MIFDASQLPKPLALEADLCVVGSGAGGAMVAKTAAEAGMRVIVLEAGPFLSPADMTQREEEMFPRLLWEAGNRMTADRGIRVLQGRAVGGSTVHNLNLCKRIPRTLLQRWTAAGRLGSLDSGTWDALYTDVERMLGVSGIPPALRNRNNRLLEQGCKALGYRGGPVQHNRSGCIGSGFCELGCAYDAKNNAAKVLIPAAVAAGAEVVTQCQAVRVVLRGNAAVGVEAVSLDPERQWPLGRVEVEAPRVCLSGSATATAAILLRSRCPDPGDEVGKRLRLHPAVVVAGEFEAPVRAWQGIPQAYECTEFLDFDPGSERRIWIVPAVAHPAGVASMLPGHGALHREFMTRYAHLGALTAVLHDDSHGRVSPDGDLNQRIDYWPSRADRRQLAMGLSACARLLFAAGARKVLVPTTPPRVLTDPGHAQVLARLELTPGYVDLAAAHPMGTVPMGDDPSQAAVGSHGQHHHVEGLWVADGSLFPGSIGVPPQLSIYALGLRVGRAIAQGS